jgi:hypothetical protein
VQQQNFIFRSSAFRLFRAPREAFKSFNTTLPSSVSTVASLPAAQGFPSGTPDEPRRAGVVLTWKYRFRSTPRPVRRTSDEQCCRGAPVSDQIGSTDNVRRIVAAAVFAFFTLELIERPRC